MMAVLPIMISTMGSTAMAVTGSTAMAIMGSAAVAAAFGAIRSINVLVSFFAISTWFPR